ncbi:MAG TPA: C-type lectin domain-containing protein, partial [Polyangiaceae bacterium]|nr:C-type lectin domain-containing protein [Polyangiaceae bacterium]
QDEVLLSPACVDGAVEPCTLVLGEHGGIVSCYEGVRSCAGGSFGACSDGHAFEVERGDPALAGAPGLRPLAFSAAVDCTDNPCNRYCREFEEAPSRGLLADVVTGVPPMSSWLTGNASDYPPEWQVLGNREPCQMASDCQLNTSCSDPSPGSCEHSVCSEGAALQDGCSRCADAVCEKNPFCCGPQLACAHDPCEVGTGAPLNPRCDTCVNAVCEAHPECCDDVWNEACVSYVATECAPLGQSCGCPAGGVDGGASCVLVGEETNYDWFAANAGCQEKYGFGLITIDDERENEAARLAVEGAGLEGAWLGGLEVGVGVWNWMSVGEQFFDGASGTLVPPYTYANWDSGEPTLGAAGNGVMLAPDGLWRSFPIDKPLGYLCEGPKNVLTPRQLPTLAWDSECAALAPELCGVSCSDGLGSGTCTAHVPTDLDASCAGYDLSLGATCEEAGTSQIPVCNHGQTAAPAGLRLVHLPIEQFRRAEPDLSEAVDCTLTESIPAGRCVALSDCPGLSADRALLVNPPGATQDTFECRRDDNWSIYRPLPCGAAVCESGVHDAGRVRNTGCAIDLEHPLGVDTATARVTVGSEVPVPTCGPGEQRFGASCYLFETEPATWDDARARCRSRGDSWDLVALNSPAESDWVRSQTDPDDAVQIGLTDRAAEGSYVWSNGSCRAFDNWDTSTGQPDNAPAG